MITAAAGAAPAGLVPACPFCWAPAGAWCTTPSGERARTIHVARTRLARVLAAHADPALDAFFPPLGPCGICGVPGLDQRHRVVDAIAERLAAGEDAGDLATDYGVSPDAVHAVSAWAARWPGASS